MSICVEIEIADDGQITVGLCPPREESQEDESTEDVQTVGSVDEALQKAKELLSSQDQTSAPQVPAKPANMQEAMFGPSTADTQA
jgi:hypothetical protein